MRSWSLELRWGEHLRKEADVEELILSYGASLIGYDVQINTGHWVAWKPRVPAVDIGAHAVTAPYVPTVDAVRHEESLYSWLSEHKPLMLCGPPGSERLCLCLALCGSSQT